MATKKNKKFYRIGEVADFFDVNVSLIRFWEKEFPAIRPKKSKNGRRFYTQKELEKIHLVYHLVKEKGFTLEGAKQKLKEQNKAQEIESSIVLCLKNARQFLLQIDKELEKKQFSS